MSYRMERMDAEIWLISRVFLLSVLVGVISSVLLGAWLWPWFGPMGILLGFVPGFLVAKFGWDAIEREFHSRSWQDREAHIIDIERIRERRYQALRLKSLAANVGQTRIVADSSSWTGR